MSRICRDRYPCVTVPVAKEFPAKVYFIHFRDYGFSKINIRCISIACIVALEINRCSIVTRAPLMCNFNNLILKI